jgi:hypothetical protein
MEIFLRYKVFRERNNEARLSTAELVAEQTYGMVRQLVLPLVPTRRVKGALECVSRDTGVPYSKLRKIYYRLTDTVLHFEFKNISDALKRAALRQERLYREEADRLAALIAEREAWESQYGIHLPIYSSAVGSTSAQTGP